MTPKKNIGRARFIKGRIACLGLTISGLAKNLHVSRQWVGAIIAGRAQSERIQKAIAEALGLSYEMTWEKSRSEEDE